MKISDYQRSFATEDFRGYFRWKEGLSSSLAGALYHACHEDELVEIMRNGKLTLRSQWGINLPEHGECTVPGVWTGLNYYNDGNFYGPFLIKFPIEVLTGRGFMAFRRHGEDRERYFFVQYEALIPIFSFKGDIWRKVDPKTYFEPNDDHLSLKRGAIYDIVLTQPVTLEHARAIYAVAHPRCIPAKCAGLTKPRAAAKMKRIASDEFLRRLKGVGILDKMTKTFPDLEGELVQVEFNE